MSVCSSLLQRIHYRGPDDEGELFVTPDGGRWEQKGPCVFMGHKRLSIIDLSDLGHQPMTNEDRTLWIIFNGEIYNYREIKNELLSYSHRFVSKTDTEVILHGYETWDVEVLERLRGMFAFCLYDANKKRFFIARDRMGQKPLVYSRARGFFGVSSELKALYTYPKIGQEILPKAIHYFLTYQYIPHKYTIFRNLSKLLPAHYAIFDIRDNSFRQKRYWRPTFYVPESPLSKTPLNEKIERLGTLLEDSVRLRLRSDVPLGVFLSGGLDSSTITYFASKQLPTPPNTFSISFEEEEFDESGYAALVAQALGTHHHAYTVRSEELALLPELVWYYNEPFGDSSMIPTYYVSKATSQNVKVVLSGDGGDEVFLGYNRYLLYMNLKRIYHLLKCLPAQAFKTFFASLSKHRIMGRYPSMLHNFFSRVATNEFLNYAHYVVIIDDRLKEFLYTPEFKKLVHPLKAMDLVARPFNSTAKGDVRQAFTNIDFLTYLPGDILTKVDIASMANSLECRSPFLDHKVVEFACQLPPSDKLAFLTGKRILRKLMEGKVPNPVIRRRKMGFGVPINRWFRQKKWKRLLKEVLLDAEHIQRGYFRQDTIERLIREHLEEKYDRSAILWQLLVLEIWHQTFLQKEPKPLTFS